MTADEMFQELGFKKKEYLGVIQYERDHDIVCFFVESREFDTSCRMKGRLAEAIIKKLEELRW